MHYHKKRKGKLGPVVDCYPDFQTIYSSFSQLKILGSNGGKPAANFSACVNRRIEGPSTAATAVSGESEAFYEERKVTIYTTNLKL